MTINIYRIKANEALDNAGIEPDDYEALSDSIVPACCSLGCDVEPDGICVHGNPSVLLAMGIF